MKEITLTIDGVNVTVPDGCTVAAALLRAGVAGFRRSVTGQQRGPLCGMGVCYECRVTLDGQPQMLSCRILCAPGMDVRSDG